MLTENQSVIIGIRAEASELLAELVRAERAGLIIPGKYTLAFALGYLQKVAVECSIGRLDRALGRVNLETARDYVIAHLKRNITLERLESHMVQHPHVSNLVPLALELVEGNQQTLYGKLSRMGVNVEATAVWLKEVAMTDIDGSDASTTYEDWFYKSVDDLCCFIDDTQPCLQLAEILRKTLPSNPYIDYSVGILDSEFTLVIKNKGDYRINDWMQQHGKSPQIPHGYH